MQLQPTAELKQHFVQTYQLSEKEMEVAYLVAEGRCRKDIGKRLHKSSSTISSQLKVVYKKLKVANAAELVILFHQVAFDQREKQLTAIIEEYSSHKMTCSFVGPIMKCDCGYATAIFGAFNEQSNPS